MKTSEIWNLPAEQRTAALIARWEDLAEYTGCRTLQERDEMAAISDAIMGHLIRDSREVESLKEKLRKARLSARLWKKMAKALYGYFRKATPLVDACMHIRDGLRLLMEDR